MNRVSISITLLFLLILLLNLPIWQHDTEESEKSDAISSFQPNYLANKMLSTLYNDKGMVTHKVYAEKMEHFEELGFTLFEKPNYTIFTERTENPWSVIAEEGTLYEDNRIQLEKNVQIKSIGEGEFVQQITTSFIEINLDEKTMTSDQPVVITGQDYVIHSNGFVANMLTRKFELLDHVQTIFTPTTENAQ
ncbi:LPS export ABC transporter periplasmic protein LptC [Alteromonas sp. a30]|uniref:LPS export ABC transporter periplasmic protein LptC n=1 Tax=Alteromonas sp. a30 TaxID=2730917 RepID=UPI00227DF482|nr:LPS export ABC transporter periplasmic protein LptC [Alteromonas sp. a30]MCY7294822.1 LPS export ABC transporter periplasmic protein LptC [Alteromonas sp. a30]